jgi:hypothetical protein
MAGRFDVDCHLIRPHNDGVPKKSKLQTGQPYGTFKQSDPHPFFPNRFFSGYKKNHRGRLAHEEWATIETLQRKKADLLRRNLEAQYKARGGPSCKLRLQTGLPKGSFKYLDAHPSIPDRFFLGYRKGFENSERWASSARLKDTARKSDELKWERRKNMKKAKPEHRPIINCLYDYRDRLNCILGAGLFHLDHSIPITKGGQHHPANLQVVPAKWNSSKNNKHSKRWEVPYEKE